jgi:predicted HNH restriction endonuclease
MEDKRRDFLRHHGKLFCEVCKVSSGQTYPASMGDGFIEVHHVWPLSRAQAPVQTTLEDLILVCANCHRLIHHTVDYQGNIAALRQAFSKAP